MSKFGSYWPVIGAPAVTLVFSLGWTLDSVNTIKLLALALVAGFALAEIMTNTRRKNAGSRPWELAIPIFFLISLLVPLFFASSPIAQQIYGTTGRNLGFLHYLFLTILLIGISKLNAEFVLPRLLMSLVFTGGMQAIYGGIQFLGLDPAPWNNPEKWIFGTLGNPNYFSSFLALSAIATVFSAVKAERVWIRFLYILFASLEAGLIIASSSTQGLILLCFGVYSLLIIFLLQRSKILGLISIVLGGAITVLSLLGIFQKGPLSSYLFQDSIAYRGDYWRAGWRMFQGNWWHGVGLDSYGDYYRLFRDSTAANRRGLDLVSNSAHNLFIDLASTGGLLLVLSYIALLALVIRSTVRVFRSNSVVSKDYIVLVILWAAFNLQTLISINVSALAVWGWLFSGLLLSYANSSNTQRLKNSRSSKIHKHLGGSVRVQLVSLLCCTTLVIPLITRDVNLAKALTEGQVTRITDAVTAFPRNANQMAAVASAYDKIGSHRESLELSLRAVSENPNSFQAWKRILDNPLASSNKKAEAAQRMASLDPFL
jgi:O-antigen ligase